MSPTAILFGAIGTLVDIAERRRRAYNTAFAEAGLDWVWDPDLYRALGTVGPERIASFSQDRGLVVDAAQLEARKEIHLNASLAQDGVRIRPGVLRVISTAAAAAVPLAIQSRAGRPAVEAALAATGGLINPQIFAHIACGPLSTDAEAASFRHTLRQLKTPPARAIAVVDNAASAVAAQAAGLPFLAFPDPYAQEHFPGALGVTRHLSPHDLGLGINPQRLAWVS